MFDGSGGADDHKEVGPEGRWRMEVAEVNEGEVVETDLDGEVF